MRIAITGSPGAGKSAFCAVANAAGWPVMTVLELADEAGLVGPVDKADDARPIDVDMLISKLSKDWSSMILENESEKLVETNQPTLIDGHISHLLPVDAICIIRCNPEVLRARLEARGYPGWKVDTNVEWELLGSAWPDIIACSEEEERENEKYNRNTDGITDGKTDEKDDSTIVEGAVNQAGWGRAFEVDSTTKNPQECFKEFVQWLNSDSSSTEPANAIDWISLI